MLRRSPFLPASETGLRVFRKKCCISMFQMTKVVSDAPSSRYTVKAGVVLSNLYEEKFH
jgi:hypothetical protein